LLLLAAAQASGLLAVLSKILVTNSPESPVNKGRTTSDSQQQLLQTLLFMPAVQVYRSYDLRSYSGDGLALLSERSRAFGYVHSERFLSQLARSGASETSTDSLSAWSSDLWHPNEDSLYYVDGHHKPVHSRLRLPRGLIGRTGKILGCRALTLLHDEQGHPLMVMTGRGDQHLTVGLPTLIKRFEKQRPSPGAQQIVVDRECMSGAFLQEWSQNYTLITILKSNQYQGLASFDEVGDFMPLETNAVGEVVKEVASAKFNLPVPKQEQALVVYVALIRDHQRTVDCVPAPVVETSNWEQVGTSWMDPDWQATPTASTATESKLIPIVSTHAFSDPRDLVARYQQRWSAQENIIKDFLLPLGLDVNHGYAKQVIDNSEFRKKHDTLTKRLDRLEGWRKAAIQRCHKAGRRRKRLQEALHLFADEHYLRLNLHLGDLQRQPLPPDLIDAQIKTQKARIDGQIEQQYLAITQVLRQSNHDFSKAQRYAQQQCQVMRDLLDLEAQSCDMFQLDNRKDQLMSALKVALTNLIMWTRQQVFPEDYAKATWKRLQPFFALPGRIVKTDTHCAVHLRRFNDLALNRDLSQLCRNVNLAGLSLPDGRILEFHMETWI
jgi:hypothetical protein